MVIFSTFRVQRFQLVRAGKKNQTRLNLFIRQQNTLNLMYRSSLALAGYFLSFCLSSHIPKFLEFLNYEVLSLQEEILSYNPLTFMCMCLIYFVLESLKFSKVTNGENIDTKMNSDL